MNKKEALSILERIQKNCESSKCHGCAFRRLRVNVDCPFLSSKRPALWVLSDCQVRIDSLGNFCFPKETEMPGERSFVPDMGKVKRLAYEKGWSFSELAKRADLSLNTLFALQAKRRKASARTMYKLADALDVSPVEIIE